MVLNAFAIQDTLYQEPDVSQIVEDNYILIVMEYAYVHKEKEFLQVEIDAKPLISVLQDHHLTFKDLAVSVMKEVKTLLMDLVSLVVKIVSGEETNVFARQNSLKLLENVLHVTQELHIMEKIVYVILGILVIETCVLLAIQAVVNALDLKQGNVFHVLILTLLYKMDFVQSHHHQHAHLDISLMDPSALDALTTA